MSSSSVDPIEAEAEGKRQVKMRCSFLMEVECPYCGWEARYSATDEDKTKGTCVKCGKDCTESNPRQWSIDCRGESLMIGGQMYMFCVLTKHYSCCNVQHDGRYDVEVVCKSCKNSYRLNSPASFVPENWKKVLRDPYDNSHACYCTTIDIARRFA